MFRVYATRKHALPGGVHHGQVRFIDRLGTGVLYLLMGLATLLFIVLVLTPTSLWTTSVKAVERFMQWPHKPVMIAIAIMVVYSLNAKACAYEPGAGGATVKSSSYLNSTNDNQVDHEWCVDSGTNRFVTNDRNDFVEGTYRNIPTKVAVGGGNCTSPGYGDKIVKGTDYDVTILCRNVLLMPECAKNLMPASPFIKKGCTIVLNDYDKVLLSAKDGTPILSGHEINGLYFYKCKTVKQVTTRGKPEPYATSSDSFFGLQMGKKIGTATLDFSQKLLETHWAYGHLHFDKLRTMLNLKKGDNPECPACTMATSRQTSLSKKMPDRSPHENHRMHLDIGFTRNCDYTL